MAPSMDAVTKQIEELEVGKKLSKDDISSIADKMIKQTNLDHEKKHKW